MQSSFPDNYKAIADSMGISLYQRFSLSEAALFLRCPEKDIEKLCSRYEMDYIRVTKTGIQFFGYQLLEYLLKNVTDNVSSTAEDKEADAGFPERIIRTKELVKMTGLSRTTIWRMEKVGTFPHRVSLGTVSMGWRWSEVNEWMKQR